MADDLYEQERKETQGQYPRVFLLTITSARRLIKAQNIMREEISKYIHLDEKEIKKAEVQKRMRDEIVSAFKKNRINLDLLEKVYFQVKNAQYWTYYITGLDTDIGISGYKVASNVPELNGKIITWDKYPDFFSDDTTIAEKGKMIGIPKGVLFLTYLEASACNSVERIIPYITEKKNKTTDFLSAKSGTIIDALSRITDTALKKPAKAQEFNADGEKTDILEFESNGIKFNIEAGKFNALSITSPGTDKLKTILENMTIVNGYNKNFEISLSDYMAFLGLKDRKEAAKKAKRAVDVLGALSIRAENSKGSLARYTFFQSLIYNVQDGPRGAVITGKWADDYLELLRKAPHMVKVPRAILSIPDNRRNEYSFAKAFYLHKRINIGKTGNIENRLRVSALLENSTLPQYASLKDKSQARQKIIEPFVKAFDYLSENKILTYCFRYASGSLVDQILVGDRLKDALNDYKIFSSLIVEVKWMKEPDYTHLLEKKQARIEKASAQTEQKPKRGRPRKSNPT